MIDMQYIGHVHSPFATKFAVPRQSGLANKVEAKIFLNESIDFSASTKSLSTFSHIWLLFHFHDQKQKWRPTVAPPRLGGKKRVGVFASRSPFRPNAIGLSVVQLKSIELQCREPHLLVSGADLVDQTPILDIKPYLPYADSVEQANSGWLDQVDEERKQSKSVVWKKEVLEFLDHHGDQALVPLIEEILALDPRPAQQINGRGKDSWTVGFAGYDFTWQLFENRFLVCAAKQSIHKTTRDSPN